MEWAFVGMAILAVVASTPTGRGQWQASRIETENAAINWNICSALISNTPGKSMKDFPVCAPFSPASLNKEQRRPPHAE